VTIADTLEATPISSLDLSRFVQSAPTDAVSDVVSRMSEAGKSCACVVEDGRPVGIFTQRDVLMRVVGRPSTWNLPIAEEMTTPVRIIVMDRPVSEGLALMNDWWVRSVPVVDQDGRLVGNLSFYVVMQLMAELVERRLDPVGVGPKPRHGLTMIDFTGLNTSRPVVVSKDSTADVAAHHMRARAIGSVLVVDDRDNLVGVLTEFDLQTKVGCSTRSLSSIPVTEIMTPDPITLTARAPIADAIAQMANHGFSHIPLLGESGKPVAVASFRDIASYVESSIDAFASS
jgi:CBS domain-containing protein